MVCGQEGDDKELDELRLLCLRLICIVCLGIEFQLSFETGNAPCGFLRHLHCATGSCITCSSVVVTFDTFAWALSMAARFGLQQPLCQIW